MHHRSPDKSPPCTYSSPTYSDGQQYLQHSECKGPCQVPTLRSRISCQVNVASGHQGLQLHNVARHLLQERQNLPYDHRGNPQGPHDTDLPSYTLHQV